MRLNDFDFLNTVKKGQVWDFDGEIDSFVATIIGVGYHKIDYKIIESRRGSFEKDRIGYWTFYLPQRTPLRWKLISDSCKIIHHQDGLNCSKCNMHNKYADPNQDDGTYVCYNCR